MRVVVIGSGGYIGQHLVARLKASGVAFAAVSSSDPNGIDPENGLLRPGFRVPPGTDALIYLSQSPYSRAETPQVAHVIAVNVLSAIRAADAARRAGVQRFIYASSGNVYQPSFLPLSESAAVCRHNWYSLSKVHAEEALALLRRDMIVTIARLFGVYGPRQKNRLVPRLVEAVLRRTPIRIESHPTEASDVGGLRISLCHVEDVVEVFIKLVSARPVDCINVAGPEALSVREIAETIGSYVGQSPIFEKVSKARRSDFIADTSLLRAVCPHSFIPFKKAVGPVVESIRAYVSEESS